MPRAFLLFSCLIALPLCQPASACYAGPVPTHEALVDVGLSSIREPLHVAIYSGEEGTDECLAYLALGDLPSRRLAPRPREIAGSLVPVAKAFGAETCRIAVVMDDGVPADDPDWCQAGTFRYGGGSWSTVEDDESC